MVFVTVFPVFIPGMLQKGQQWKVYPEGPAGCSDAENLKVPSASSGSQTWILCPDNPNLYMEANTVPRI